MGQYLGRNEAGKAKLYYQTICNVSTWMILGVVALQYYYRIEIVNLYTDIEPIR